MCHVAGLSYARVFGRLVRQPDRALAGWQQLARPQLRFIEMTLEII
jgi:hypothetical protein